MAENINLNKIIRDRDDFSNVVNTSFTQLNQSQIQQNQITQTFSVGDFFNMYNNLFYEIPQSGPLSHQTLIEQSADYISYDALNESIVQAQEEINLLRSDLLEANQEINKLSIEIVDLQSKSTLLG
tara:strand:+ start:2724 stop:3101 length:378 start_codon:yes stop_codon:yes gene_type:complete